MVRPVVASRFTHGGAWRRCAVHVVPPVLMAWRASVVRVLCPRRTRKQQRRRGASFRPCPSVWTCPAAWRVAWRCRAFPWHFRPFLASVRPFVRRRVRCAKIAAFPACPWTCGGVVRMAAALCRGAWHFAYLTNDGGGRVRRCRVSRPFLKQAARRRVLKQAYVVTFQRGRPHGARMAPRVALSVVSCQYVNERVLCRPTCRTWRAWRGIPQRQ